MWPIWSPDARRVAFASLQERRPAGIYQKATDGPAAEDLLVRRPTVLTPTDWSARYLLFHWVAEGQRRRISAFPASGSGEAIPLRETAFDEGNARLSPDQQWLAYESNESGTREVYVDAFPSQGLVIRSRRAEAPSPGGAATARASSSWLPIATSWTVSFDGTGTPRLGIPRALFELPIENPTLGFSPSTYDVDASGRRFPGEPRPADAPRSPHGHRGLAGGREALIAPTYLRGMLRRIDRSSSPCGAPTTSSGRGQLIEELPPRWFLLENQVIGAR
jgi:hypothetical protein